MRRLPAIAIYVLVSLIGLIAFTYPLFLPALTQANGAAMEAPAVATRTTVAIATVLKVRVNISAVPCVGLVASLP